MKYLKRFTICAACLCLLASLTGCSGAGSGGKETTASESAGQTETGTAAATEGTDQTSGTDETTAGTGSLSTLAPVEKEPYDALKYVDLGEYKGIEVSKAQIDVDDETVENVLASELARHAYQQEVTDRPAKEGDTVNIDYKGMKDGVAFEGGTAQGYDLTLGSGSFIDGFEDGLIGAETGETRNLELKFPDPYKNNPDLAGQPVVFEVTVNKIVETVTPELTDEYAAENSDYATAEEYREGLRDIMREQNKKNAVLDALMEQAEFQEAPENLTAYYQYDMIQQTSYQAAAYGMSFEQFLEASSMTQEQFLEARADEIDMNVRRDMLMEAMIALEKLELTDQEFNDGVAEVAESYGRTKEEVISIIGEDVLRENFLWNKAIDLLAENAAEVD